MFTGAADADSLDAANEQVNALREAVLGEWLALETQTDVQTLRLLDPARVGDEVRAQTFGVLA